MNKTKIMDMFINKSIDPESNQDRTFAGADEEEPIWSHRTVRNVDDGTRMSVAY